MKNMHKPKIGSGILTLTIIQLVFSGLGLIGLIMTLLVKYTPTTAEVPATSTYNVISTLLITIITILGIILILMKKKLGIYMYFIAEAANIVYSVTINGFDPVILVSLIIPAFLAIFLWMKKEIFAI